VRSTDAFKRFARRFHLAQIDYGERKIDAVILQLYDLISDLNILRNAVLDERCALIEQAQASSPRSD
jgi:hypothetical protein